MPNNNSIDTWTREECEEYLKHFSKSLKSDAVRKRLRALTPQPQPTQPPKTPIVGNNVNVADVVGTVKQTKESDSYPPKNQTTKQGAKPQSTSNSQQNQMGGSSSVDEHDRETNKRRENVKEAVEICGTVLVLGVIVYACVTKKWEALGLLVPIWAIGGLIIAFVD